MRPLVLSIALSCITAASAWAEVIISEFLADNASGIKDEDETRQDWIELYNSGPIAVSLNGWWLTDNASQPAKWQFPNVTIPSGGTLFIWASGKDRTVTGQPLHTNFSLSKTGEYLGLYMPAAGTGLPQVVHQFSPAYPAQATDVSYGISVSQSTVNLVASNQSAKYRVLTNNSTGANHYSGSNYGAGNVGTGLAGGWNVSPSFSDATWTACSTGLGYDAETGLEAWIATDCEGALRNVNTSLLFRRLR